MSKVLSPFPYYGGKAKMCPLICELLDYRTQIYVEPFGGGCRTLLNKKRHEAEIYNDYGYGLVTFMSVMADPDKTEELIERMLEEPPSKESFSRLIVERMEIEDRLNTSTNAELASLALGCYRKYNHAYFKQLGGALRKERYDIIVDTIKKILQCNTYELEAVEWLQFEHYGRIYEEYWELVKDEYIETYEDAVEDFEKVWPQITAIEKPTGNTKRRYETYKEQYARECALAAIQDFTSDILNSNEKGTSVRDVDVAFNIFQLYYCSRDGMGTAWSDYKNQKVELYYKAVRNLRKISERMRGVTITQVDALDLVRQYRRYENVMFYLDPSYLKPEDEWKNLGKVYRMSYGYEDHEKLLKEITEPDTKAKIMISNYDIELYQNYLSDWNKVYFNTYTSVGGKSGNRRVEVLWKNY